MIRFKTLKLQNFLSVGNIPLEIEFERNPVTLITGSNGAGKSSINCDGMTFALFGRAYRKINKNQLINSINERGCLTEIGFETKGKTYRVVRGIKPDIFEIYEDGEMWNQEAAVRDYQRLLETNVLGMNIKTFKQVAILSVSNYTPFMELSAYDRRSIVEDLLDIQIFSVMNQVLAERKSELSEGKRKIETAIKLLDTEIRAHQEKLESLRAKDASIIQTNQQKIDETLIAVKDRMEQVERWQAVVGELQNELDKLDTAELKRKTEKVRTMFSKISVAQNKFKSEIEFFELNHECPSCSQEIGADLRDRMVEIRTKKLEETEVASEKLQAQSDALDKLVRRAKDLAEKITEANREIFSLNTSIQHNQKYVSELEAMIRDIQSKSDEEERVETERLEQMEQKRVKSQEALSKAMIREEDYQVCQKLLKDSGIKAMIIDKYIPTINRILNHYLELLGYNISFNFDKNFNEVIRSRYRDEFSYASFSSGERARIDFALIMTFREIAKLKNSVGTNVIVLDELFENMDSVGIVSALDILRNLRDSHSFIVTHKQDLIEAVHTQIRLVKQDGFTVMA